MWQSPGILADQQPYMLTYFALLLFVVKSNAEDKSFVAVEGLEFEVMWSACVGLWLTLQVSLCKSMLQNLHR